MPSSTFHFKQFSIQQDKCAMKVSTDGILLGSWAEVPTTGKALDIGTGTGILALMLAQQSSQLTIDAVEIDEDASLQAKENVQNSSFAHQIQVFHSSIQDFDRSKCYDLIVSNPPYFEKSGQESLDHRKVARQQVHLSHQTLVDEVTDRLTDQGHFFLILPADQVLFFEGMCLEKGLMLRKKTAVKYQEQKPISRYLMGFGKEKGEVTKGELVIQRGGSNVYTEDFIRLSREFYAFMP